MSLENKKFKNFNGTGGMGTKKWGPPAWFFFFVSIMGAYPYKIDKKNPEHKLIKKHFKNMFISLQYTMPCVFCRNSYKQFLKESPIDEHMDGRIELMKWLYEMKNKVNKKLLAQERECYNDKKKELKNKYRQGKITREKYYELIDEYKKISFNTQPTPEFVEVLEYYEQFRAVCSPKSKTCEIKKKGKK